MRASALVVLLAVAALPASGQDIAVRAENVVTIGGPMIRNGVVLIKDGKIAAVGTNLPIPSGATVLQAHTVMPGLIDAHSYLGCYREVSEFADSLTPELRAADSFDSTDPAIVRALRAGVTTAGIMPPNTNVIAGQAAVIRLGPSPGLLVESAGLKISISAESANPNRNPTSRAGIVDLLRRAIVSARAGRAVSGTTQTRLLAGGIPTTLSNRVTPIASLANGKARAFIHAPRIGDAEAALEIMRGAGGAPFALLHSAHSATHAPDLKAAGAAVVLGPLRFSDNERVLAEAGKLARAGVPVAFCTDAPLADPGSLRMTALLAVKHGMSRESALRALTSNGARVLGIANRTGTIAPGLDADLLLLDGDPLDLTSRVQAVIAGGKVAYREGK